MERDKQYIENTKEENWTEEQEKEYWHKINKRYDAQYALDHIHGLSSMDIVDTIATAKGYTGTDIFKDCARPALEYEIATNTFLNEVRKITAKQLRIKTSVDDRKEEHER